MELHGIPYFVIFLKFMVEETGAPWPFDCLVTCTFYYWRHLVYAVAMQHTDDIDADATELCHEVLFRHIDNL